MKDQNPDFKYLFVPELHKSKRWHFHSIGVNCDKLKFENSGIAKNINSIQYVILITLLNFAINNSIGFIGNGNMYSKSFEKKNTLLHINIA